MSRKPNPHMLDIEDLREYIIDFSIERGHVGKHGYNRVLLQLFGLLGHGKSAFVNSCKHVLDNKEFQVYAKVAPSTTYPETMDRNSYKLTDTITIVDNRGCAKMDSLETGEILTQLANFMPLDERIEWGQNYDDLMCLILRSDMDPNLNDLIIPVFVYSVEKGVLPEKEVNEMKNFMDNCRKVTEFWPIIILTKKGSGSLSKVTEQFNDMGAENVFPVENFTEEDHISTKGRVQDFLNILYSTLVQVNHQLNKTRNPRKERIERKIFLLRILHERERVRDRENVMKDAEREKGKEKNQSRPLCYFF